MGQIAMPVGFLIAASALMVATASAMDTTDKNTDRPGGNYKKFVTFDGLSCKMYCSDERQKCRAWAWVPASKVRASERAQVGDQGMCYLKNRVPDPVPDKNVFSGKMDPPAPKLDPG